MKTTITLSVLLTAIIMVALSMVPNLSINMRLEDCDQTQHTFKLYNSMFDSWTNRNPIDSVTIPIAENGNYVGDPSQLSFNGWLAMSTINPDNFNIERYTEIFIQDDEGSPDL